MWIELEEKKTEAERPHQVSCGNLGGKWRQPPHQQSRWVQRKGQSQEVLRKEDQTQWCENHSGGDVQDNVQISGL